jgi:SAM-dependent methyltransferase
MIGARHASARRAPGPRPSTLGAREFARLFGVESETLAPELRARIAAQDFRHRVLDDAAQLALAEEIVARVEAGTFTTAGPEGKARWDRGWGENLAALRASGGDPRALRPRYIREAQPVRLFRRWAVPADAEFEARWYEIFRDWLATTFLADADAIFEFGCGSGHNLAALAERFPEKRLVGLDWSAASLDILAELAWRHGWKVEGRLFDFFRPDPALVLPPRSVVLTVGALEQTGSEWGAFVDWLLAARPMRVVTIEPIVEWYDADDPVDLAAIRFHTARNYWRGFPARLAALEEAGRVEVLARKRSYFGSLYIEGYSQLIWRPTGRAR